MLTKLLDFDFDGHFVINYELLITNWILIIVYTPEEVDRYVKIIYS